MAESKIQWTTYTANWWGGCTKVSAGCKNCYAETATPIRTGGIEWGPGEPRKLFKSTGNSVAMWNRKALDAIEAWWKAHDDPAGADPGPAPERPRIFWESLSDWLDDEVDPEWRVNMLDAIRGAGALNHLMLTKRPENFGRLMTEAMHLAAEQDAAPGSLAEWIGRWLGGRPPENVMIMTSTEDQANADRRIPALLQIPATARALSVEPLLGPVRFARTHRHVSTLDWVILGGESGPDARPCHLAWIHEAIEELRILGIPTFVKQLGAVPVIAKRYAEAFAKRYGEAVTKGRPVPGRGDLMQWPLKHKKGGNIAEWPEAFQVREEPRDRSQGNLLAYYQKRK